jgi:hypothetical protein
MKAPRPQTSYDNRWASEFKRVFDELEQRARKTGEDVEVADNRLILTAPNGNRYAVTVSNTGALSTVLL